MADYKDIIRKPETVNWFKAAMGLNITSDCLLVIVKGIAQIYYDNIRQEIKQQNGIPENVVCNQCNTPNVVLCDPQNKCCNRGRCTFHEIHKPRNCPINNLCHEIRQQIAKQHRFCNPTWINTDASKWCTDPWHIAKCFLPKDGYKDVNQAEDTDFNGLVNVIYNCEYYESYFNNDLTDKENVCTKAREVGRTVRHKTTMSMTSQDSNSAIDTLVALLQSLKHADHQAASRTTVDKLTQLKNGTLVITDEDIAITFEHFKETLTREIKDVLQDEKNSLVNVMADALKITGKNITEEIIHTGDGQIERINSQIDRIERTGDEVMNKIDNTFTKAKSSNGDETTRPTVENRNCLSSKIQKWLIKQYQSMCVVPISMLDSGIDVPLSRIYVTPSISELKRGQNGGRKALPSSSGDRDLSSYKELLHRDGKEVNTIYIQGDQGCGKTTFCTKLVLDWCKAHSETMSSATTSKETSNKMTFDDLDTLRDYTFLFFVSLGDYSGVTCDVSQMVEDAIKRNRLDWTDRIWEHKCIVLTDAADEWHHPSPPFDSACKCLKDRTMPQYLQRQNITNIVTAQPWKLADVNMSDTLTRLCKLSGVVDYTTLSKNVVSVLAEKDGISQEDQQHKYSEFLKTITTNNIKNLIKIPSNCVQLVHQFYVGRLIEESLCAIYTNMLDMHITRGLQKLQIEIDSEENKNNEIPYILRKYITEDLHSKMSLIYSASKFAFKTLTDTNRQASFVFPEDIIKKHMTETERTSLLKTGIITQRKSLELSTRKNVPYMFVHKSIQEYLASVYIAINPVEMDANLNALQLAFSESRPITDIGQLFIFTCGMCPSAAEKISKHIMDVMTRGMESTLLDKSVQNKCAFDQCYEAQCMILDGFMESNATKTPFLQLFISHITCEPAQINADTPLNALLDMNIANIVSLNASIICSKYTSQEIISQTRLQQIISQSRKTLLYLSLENKGQINLQDLKLKYLGCEGATDLTNVDCSNMVECSLSATPVTEKCVFDAMKGTGKNIRLLHIDVCKSIDLLCEALPHLPNLNIFELLNTALVDTQLHDHMPESIRCVEYRAVMVSEHVFKSMVKWSKTRDVQCTLFYCNIAFPDETDISHWIKEQDGINIKEILGTENNLKIVWCNTNSLK